MNISFVDSETPAWQSMNAGSLVVYAHPVSPHELNDEVFRYFENSPELRAVAIVNADGIPQGLINRYMMIDSYARPYRRELRGRKPCSTMMDCTPIMVDARMTVEDVAHIISSSASHDLNSVFIIIRDGRYLGLGYGQDILRAQLAQFRQAKQIAEGSERAKSEFLANMSHEIRTPMNAIIGLAQLVLNSELPESQREYVNGILDSSQSLLGILNDVLDLSKLEAKRLTIEKGPFNLAGMLRNLNNLFQATAHKKNIEFGILVKNDVPEHLVGDSLRIQQVLTNLIGNAVKFTAHGKVTLGVRLKKLEHSKAKVRFIVRDTGIGMSKEDQAKLFQPFTQADASITRRFGGSGLGLSISRQLLILMDSDIRVKSALGKGTVFRFDLVLDVAPQESRIRERYVEEVRGPGFLTRKIEGSSVSLRGKRILVVEDVLINQRIIQEFLKISHIEVEVANHGQEALELLQKHPYDAILMDVHMPVMGGWKQQESCVESTSSVLCRLSH